MGLGGLGWEGTFIALHVDAVALKQLFWLVDKRNILVLNLDGRSG